MCFPSIFLNLCSYTYWHFIQVWLFGVLIEFQKRHTTFNIALFVLHIVWIFFFVESVEKGVWLFAFCFIFLSFCLFVFFPFCLFFFLSFYILNFLSIFLVLYSYIMGIKTWQNLSNYRLTLCLHLLSQLFMDYTKEHVKTNITYHINNINWY